MKFAPTKAQLQAPIVRKPSAVIVVPPSAFADDWASKPTTEVAIGLRFVSQSDVDAGRREAEREAVGFYAELRGTPIPASPEVAVDVHNDALMALAVARGTCDPNDVSKPYFRAAEELVRVALTPAGIRHIYDELVRFTKGHSPGIIPASDDEVRRLGARLRRGVLDLDDESRKLMAYLLAKHGGDDLDEDEPTADATDFLGDEAEDVAVYAVHAG